MDREGRVRCRDPLLVAPHKQNAASLFVSFREHPGSSCSALYPTSGIGACLCARARGFEIYRPLRDSRFAQLRLFRQLGLVGLTRLSGFGQEVHGEAQSQPQRVRRNAGVEVRPPLPSPPRLSWHQCRGGISSSRCGSPPSPGVPHRGRDAPGIGTGLLPHAQDRVQPQSHGVLPGRLFRECPGSFRLRSSDGVEVLIERPEPGGV